jgi:hypothetical protein
MTDAVQKLLDLEEIKNLRNKYGHYLDSNSMTELGELFALDAVCDFGQGPLRGRDAIRNGLQQAFIDYDLERRGSHPFLHAVTNHWVELIDADTAQGRCYLLDLQTIAKPTRDPWILLGSYADEYRRIDGKWYLARSQLDIFWPERNGGGGHPGNGLVLPAPAER